MLQVKLDRHYDTPRQKSNESSRRIWNLGIIVITSFVAQGQEEAQEEEAVCVRRDCQKIFHNSNFKHHLHHPVFHVAAAIKKPVVP